MLMLISILSNTFFWKISWSVSLLLYFCENIYLLTRLQASCLTAYDISLTTLKFRASVISLIRQGDCLAPAGHINSVSVWENEHTRQFPLYHHWLCIWFCGWKHSWRPEGETGFWTFREKSTTGQPCVMQPREMMSTCGEKYKARLSGVTPPLASISVVGNSTFSAWASTWSSWQGGEGVGVGVLFHVKVAVWVDTRWWKWVSRQYLRQKVV